MKASWVSWTSLAIAVLALAVAWDRLTTGQRAMYEQMPRHERRPPLALGSPGGSGAEAPPQ